MNDAPVVTLDKNATIFAKRKNNLMPRLPFWVFVVIALLYLVAIRVDTMDVDASQYAEMSREMMRSGDHLHLYDRGHDYLDKPPLLFWLSSASMRVCGVNNLGYKLPSILMALLALYATYRLGKRLYDESTGRLSALVLATCQGMFLMTNDVRCDTVLMSWVVTAIWLMSEWLARRKVTYLLAASACIALSMMTKGPIALMVPVFCFGTDLILKRQWKDLINPWYIVCIALIGVLLLPMSIGLYQQFDLHPEKVVNGQAGTSGLRFFYWSQSFGRITGESPWKNGADMSFLLVNMLWSFLPWILLFLPALVINVTRLIRERLRLQAGQEWVTTGGFILTYIVLGKSAYQLPHYIFVVFPLAAIMTGKLLNDLISGSYPGLKRVIYPILTALSGLLLVAALVLMVASFAAPAVFVIVWVVLALLWLYLLFKKTLPAKIVWLQVAAMLVVNLCLSSYIYPSLLRYEVGAQVGRYISDNHIDPGQVMAYKMHDPLNALDFYADGVIEVDTALQLQQRQVSTVRPDGKPITYNYQTIADPQRYILTMDEGLEDVKRITTEFVIVQHGRLFKVSELTPEFLNPATRDSATKAYYLLRLTH
jgi:4-amino-4-deoxy-L-arabinose transferase-like glycosyltransferase